MAANVDVESKAKKPFKKVGIIIPTKSLQSNCFRGFNI
jgi:hypothetical protein